MKVHIYEQKYKHHRRMETLRISFDFRMYDHITYKSILFYNSAELIKKICSNEEIFGVYSDMKVSVRN